LVSVSVVGFNKDSVFFFGQSVSEDTGSSNVKLSLGITKAVESSAAGVFSRAS
jgi:hypothetical protein